MSEYDWKDGFPTGPDGRFQTFALGYFWLEFGSVPGGRPFRHACMVFPRDVEEWQAGRATVPLRYTKILSPEDATAIEERSEKAGRERDAALSRASDLALKLGRAEGEAEAWRLRAERAERTIERLKEPAPGVVEAAADSWCGGPDWRDDGKASRLCESAAESVRAVLAAAEKEPRE